jgi:hypothetical protein
MIRISLLSTAVAVSLLSSGALFAPANAASNPHMQACSAQWQSMKTAGTTNGMKWTDFLKTCGTYGAQPASAAAQPAATPAVTAQAAPKGHKLSKAAKAAAALAAAATAAPVIATPSSASAAAAPVAAPAPIVAAASPVTRLIRKFTTKSTAQPAAAAVVPASATGGKLGEQTRIKACGAQWQSAKAASSVPAGQTWPQFWSACDTRLKAANG